MSDEKISCKICGEDTHHIGKHLEQAHPGETEASYAAKFPGAPLVSPKFEAAVAAAAMKAKNEKKAAQAMVAKILPFQAPNSTMKKPIFEVFELPLSDELRSAPRKNQTEGDPIMIDVLTNLSPDEQEAVPDIDPDYVFSVGELKDALMSIALNDNTLAWGMHGTGKTTLIEQICARTNRPWIRVQHTDTTEEAHIIGQMVVRDGGTEFDFGPLVEAMMRGWLYCADEYDFAHAAVIAVYQPVLEGKPLYIKEAPPGQRLIKPHPNFRFFATGNTNGSGDDTGLYAGTKIGNAAAYSRFGTTIQVHYPEEKVEIALLRARTGVTEDIAKKLVDFANRVRQMFAAGEISLPISPRELIGAAKKGIVTGGKFRHGINLNYANRLDATQGEAIRQTAQRILGGS